VKIDHFNTFITGGAANAARRLHQGLLAAGVESRFWTRPPRREISLPCESVRFLAWPLQGGGPKLWGRVSRALFKKLQLKFERFWSLSGRPPGLEAFTSPCRERATLYSSIPNVGDLIHLHWISKLIDFPTFFKSIPAGLPVVWTLHDMNPFTGGCHFAGDCERFTAACGRCPQLGRGSDHDLSHRGYRIKKQSFEGLNLHIVTPSRWLEGEARRSSLLAAARSFRTIHYGLDTSVFQPQNQLKARQQWGLPDDRLVIGFGADSLNIRRKGMTELIHALRPLTDREDLLILIFGSGEFPETESLPRIHHVGRIAREENLAKVYAAMDLFVLPSLEDNSPQTGLEALSCGIPVVGFNSGGISDYVLHEETGLLARPADSTDLSRNIERLVDAPPEKRRAMSVNGRQLILQRFEQEQQTQAYIDLYEELLADRAEFRRPGVAA
jgi:glycosyltransferase involved in cell wall biosynthesis